MIKTFLRCLFFFIKFITFYSSNPFHSGFYGAYNLLVINIFVTLNDLEINMLISLDPNHNFQRYTLKQYHTQLNT